MPKYNELAREQRILVDTSAALTISEVVGKSAEIPLFVASPTYLEELRNKLSARITQLEKSRYDLYIQAQDAGINVDNPQEYITRAVNIVKKMNLLNPNQSARSYQRAANGSMVMAGNSLPKSMSA